MQNDFEYLLLKKLLGTITLDEEMDFNLWLKANPAYAAAYIERKKIWTQVQEEAPEFQPENPHRMRNPGRPARYGSKPFRVADVIAVLAMLAAAFLFYQGIRSALNPLMAKHKFNTPVLEHASQHADI